MNEYRVVLTVAETATALRISRGTAYAAVREGRLPHLRIGKRILVPRVALDRLLEQAGSTETPANPAAPRTDA
jgi:excisionase family DNA binding protein